jgi:hypothetical protein
MKQKEEGSELEFQDPLNKHKIRNGNWGVAKQWGLGGGGQKK